MVNSSFYVSLEGEAAKLGKTDILNGQIEILNMMERIQTLQEMRKQMNQLREKVRKAVTILHADIKQFEKDVPELESVAVDESELKPRKKTPEQEGLLPIPTKKELKELMRKGTLAKKQEARSLPQFPLQQQFQQQQQQFRQPFPPQQQFQQPFQPQLAVQPAKKPNALQQELEDIREKLRKLNS